MSLFQFGQGQTERILREAHGGNGGFDRDRVDLAEERVDQGVIMALKVRRTRDVARKEPFASRERFSSYGDDLDKPRDGLYNGK